MTQDYRGKLRELDNNYADKKRDIDRARHALEQEVTLAHENFDNPNFGMEGDAHEDTGIHFMDHS